MSLPSTTITTANRSSAIVAGDNPIILGLSTNSIGSAGNAKAKIKVLSTSTNNVKLTFDITGVTTYNKTFTGKEYPNKDEYFLSGTLKDGNGNTLDSTITTSQIASSIADSLKKDIVISKDYFINYSGATIIELIAKEASTKFSLAGRVTSSSPSNISFTSISAGSDEFSGSKIPDYSLYVEVYKGNDSIELGDAYDISKFSRITEVSLPFANDNVHRFDLSKVCKNFVTTPRPDFETVGFTTTQNTNEKFVLPFVFVYGEQYPLVAGTNTRKKLQKGTTAQSWVCNASLPFTSANNLSAYTGSTGVSFLTKQPTVKRSGRDQKELLHFLIKKNYGQGLNVKADVKFWDGTTSTNQTLYPLFAGSTNYGGLYSCNVSYDSELSGFETAAKKIKQVDISVKPSSGSYTLVQSYKYDFPNLTSNNSFNVAFQNSLGTYDTFGFIGLSEETISRSKKDLTNPLSINQDGSIDQGSKYSANYDVQIIKSITVNTGWIDETHFDWLIELMGSNDIYSYNDSKTNYLKLEGYKYSKNNQTNEFNIEVTFVQTIFENNVTV